VSASHSLLLDVNSSSTAFSLLLPLLLAVQPQMHQYSYQELALYKLHTYLLTVHVTRVNTVDMSLTVPDGILGHLRVWRLTHKVCSVRIQYQCQCQSQCVDLYSALSLNLPNALVLHANRNGFSRRLKAASVAFGFRPKLTSRHQEIKQTLMSNYAGLVFSCSDAAIRNGISRSAITWSFEAKSRLIVINSCGTVVW